MMKFVCIFILLIGFGFVAHDIYIHRNDPAPPPSQPNLVTTAPDGTKLYHFYTDGHDIYFSRAGTTHKECRMVGKITQCDTVTTPNAQ